MVGDRRGPNPASADRAGQRQLRIAGDSLTDWSLNFLAGVLALATIALCLATILLWWSTRKLVMEAVTQGRDMKRAVEIAADAARASSELAAATKLSADAATSAATTARAALVNAARPRVVARRLTLYPPKPGQKVLVRVELANKGASVARIAEYWCEVVVGQAMPAWYPVNPPHREASPLIAGQFTVHDATTDQPITEKEFFKLQSGDLSVFLMGQINYADDVGTVRQTGFARGYDHKSGRFIPIDDPDYEFID
jgi:hypothetical protein